MEGCCEDARRPRLSESRDSIEARFERWYQSSTSWASLRSGACDAGRRFVAAESNTTNQPTAEIAGRDDGPLPWPPSERETRRTLDRPLIMSARNTSLSVP